MDYRKQNAAHRFAITLTIALVIAMFGFVAGVGARAVSAAVGDTATITTGTLTVRSDAGPGYPSVGQVSLGDVVTMLGRTNDSSWIKVKLADGVTAGWVSTFYIQASSPVAELPVLADAQPWGMITASVLNIRTGPGLEFNVLTTVGQGTFLTVLGRNADSTWINVLVGGAEGWVGRGFISLSVPTAGSLPVVDAPPTPDAGNGGGGTATAPPPASDAITAVINTGELNVRFGAGPGYPVVTKVVLGDVVTLLARNSNSSWVYVTAPDGKKGWISTFYITASALLGSLPVKADFTPTGWITASVANLRKGPSLSADVITTLNQNTFVGVLGRSADSAWIKISASGVEGWVGGGTIAFNVPASSLSIVAE